MVINGLHMGLKARNQYILQYGSCYKFNSQGKRRRELFQYAHNSIRCRLAHPLSVCQSTARAPVAPSQRQPPDWQQSRSIHWQHNSRLILSIISACNIPLGTDNLTQAVLRTHQIGTLGVN